MAEHPIPTPDQCPEPFWHETHHYCPVCSWVNPDRPLTESERLRAELDAMRNLMFDAVAVIEDFMKSNSGGHFCLQDFGRLNDVLCRERAVRASIAATETIDG